MLTSPKILLCGLNWYKVTSSKKCLMKSQKSGCGKLNEYRARLADESPKVGQHLPNSVATHGSASALVVYHQRNRQGKNDRMLERNYSGTMTRRTVTALPLVGL